LGNLVSAKPNQMRANAGYVGREYEKCDVLSMGSCVTIPPRRIHKRRKRNSELNKLNKKENGEEMGAG